MTAATPYWHAGANSVRVKDCFDLQLGKMLQSSAATSEDREVAYVSVSAVQWGRFVATRVSKMYADTAERARYSLRPGDLLVCEGGEGGRAAIYPGAQEGRLIFQNHVIRVNARSARETSNRYLRYVLEVASSLGWLNATLNGATIRSLSKAQLGRLQIPWPTEDEQVLIVRYLDHAELRIAKAIAAKQGLVRLLHERRSAIEAELLLGVPDASSGSWFGRLPDSWTRLPARAICSERILRGSENLDLLSVTIRRGVIPQREYFSTDGSKKDQSRTDKAQYKVVKPGDVVYNKMRAWQGAAGCSTFEGIVSPAYVVIQPNQLVDPYFLGRVMRTPQFAKEAERWSYGINSDMWSLRPQHFKLIEFAVPPLAVQEDLVRRCVERTEAVEAALEAVESEIALLKEYRTRLISDVVTGKFDVREEAAKLPDIDPAELAAVLAGGAAGADDEEVADGDD